TSGEHRSALLAASRLSPQRPRTSPCCTSRPRQPTLRCSCVATLIYATNVSLDGYIEDAHGAFDWAPPDDDVFAAATALLRSVGTFLYGRRLYATMAVWDT